MRINRFAIGCFVDFQFRMPARQIFPVETREHLGQLMRTPYGNEGVTHRQRIWMQSGIFDAEFAHLAATCFRAINFRRQPIVFLNHLPLFVQARRIGQ